MSFEYSFARTKSGLAAKRFRAIAAFLTFCGFALSSALALPAAAQFKPWSGSSIISDPEWQKSFLGSYGFLSGAEPDIRPSELEILKEVIDLLKVNPKAAALMLAQRKPEDSSAALDFVLANLGFQNGDTAAAMKGYDDALRKFPDFRRAHKNLGLLKVQVNQYGDAITHLSRAVELGDRDGRSFGLLGYCFVNEENFVAAEQAYRSAILQQPAVRDWQLGLARSLLAMNKNEEAAALFATLIDKNPEDATAWMLQANALLALDQPTAAAVNLEAVRMLGKADAATLTLLGDIYMNEGISDLAKEAYLEVVKSDASGASFKSAHRAAELLYRSQAYKESAEIIRSIDDRYGKKLSNDNELLLMTLKAKLARAQGRPKEAARLLESIVNRDGTRGDALLELARFHRDQGATEKAILMLERAANLDGFEYQALVEQAQLQVSKKDYEKAAGLLKQALRIKSEPRIERFLARIEEVARRR